jgi:hypothetical protein
MVMITKLRATTSAAARWNSLRCRLMRYSMAPSLSALYQFYDLCREPFGQFLVFKAFAVAAAAELDDQVDIVRRYVAAADIAEVIALAVEGTHRLVFAHYHVTLSC